MSSRGPFSQHTRQEDRQLLPGDCASRLISSNLDPRSIQNPGYLSAGGACSERQEQLFPCVAGSRSRISWGNGAQGTGNSTWRVDVAGKTQHAGHDKLFPRSWSAPVEEHLQITRSIGDQVAFMFVCIRFPAMAVECSSDFSLEHS